MAADCGLPCAALRGAHVVVGLSGGVDSSLTAALLCEQGLQVQALFMKNWEEDDTDGWCAAAADRADAQAVCDHLGIELLTINFAFEYWEEVFTRFLAEYEAGRTPNPDILCNAHIKFDAFLAYALGDLHADFIATGHYARRSRETPAARLLRGVDRSKDQSYFLHAVPGTALARTLFPLGGLTKAQVRAMARERGLPTWDKKDSTGICFIGERRFQEFLRRFLPARPGPILSVDGTQLGCHAGLMSATIGQRRGLGLGGRHGGSGEAWYVVDKDPAANALIVAQGRDHPARFARALIACEPVFVVNPPPFPLKCTCKTRYRQRDLPCCVRPCSEGLEVLFEQPVAAIAPGQSVVFYQGEECLGGAVIARAIKEC